MKKVLPVFIALLVGYIIGVSQIEREALSMDGDLATPTPQGDITKTYVPYFTFQCDGGNMHMIYESRKYDSNGLEIISLRTYRDLAQSEWIGNFSSETRTGMKDGFRDTMRAQGDLGVDDTLTFNCNWQP